MEASGKYLTTLSIDYISIASTAIKKYFHPIQYYKLFNLHKSTTSTM